MRSLCFVMCTSMLFLISSEIAIAEAPPTEYADGKQAFKDKEFSDAILYFEECVEADPDNPDYMCWLAKSLAYELGELGKQGESRFSLISKGKRIYDLYHSAYKADPENPDAKLGYAILKRDLPSLLLGGDLDLAEELFTELLEEDPRNVLASYHLGKLYLLKRENFPMGMRFMQRALEIAKTKELDIQETLYMSNIHHAIGKAYIDNDQPEEAIPYLTNSLELEDGSVPTLIDLARVYSITNSEDIAIDYLKRAIAISNERDYTFFDDDLKSIAKDLGVSRQVDI